MKVAITQDNIVGGGRLAVIIEIIEVLNILKIIPTIITFNMHLSKYDIKKRYSRSVNFKTIILKPNIFKKLPEFNKLWFNFITRKFSEQFDLFIDSNNTSFLMTKRKPILSLIYYPRIDRVLRNESIHGNSEDNVKLITKVGKKLDQILARNLYKHHRIPSNHVVYTISEFSKNAVIKHYHCPENKVKIIYPPVITDSFNPSKEKKNSVATIARFTPSKNQLMQIKIAEQVPNLEFHIMGFADIESSYYRQCEKYIKEHNINNVYLHPNINYNSMIDILESSKYFLHTMWNEPFGITTVQGIAAGCVPVVSNSGGQTEIVPINFLRFDTINDAVKILHNLSHIDVKRTQAELLLHIQSFRKEQFQCTFKKELLKIITINNK